MSKIIYLKTEVSLGDIIDFEGMKIIVTSELIKNNPVKFEIREDTIEYVRCTVGVEKSGRYDSAQFNYIYPVINGYITGDTKFNVCEWGSYESEICFTSSTFEEYQKQELLVEAAKNYTKGTRFKSASATDDNIYIATGNCIPWYNSKYSDAIANSDEGLLYAEGKWAKIISPILTTEDGVDVYKNHHPKLYWVKLNNYQLGADSPNSLFNADLINYKYFSTKELAETYVKANKEWTLEDYESLLLKANGKYSLDPFTELYKCDYWLMLRNNEPKLYWTKILIEVSKKLNKGFTGNCGYIISHDLDVQEISAPAINDIIFKTKELAKKAIQIIGKENLNKIYTNN